MELIVLQAMEREPSRRYPSAGALARDLRRFQAGEPIDARAPSWTYRASLWARRWRRPLIAAGLVLATATGWAFDAQQRAQAEAEAHIAAAAERWDAVRTRLTDANAEEGRAIVEGFVAEFRGTPAAAEAWSTFASLRAAVGDRETELAALALAYRDAGSEGDAADALLRLAEGFAARWQWTELAVALDTLRSEHPDRWRDAEALRQQLAYARSDFEVITGQNPGDDAFLGALGHGIPLDFDVRAAEIVDIDGDGKEELVVEEADRWSVRALAPGLPLLKSQHFPQGKMPSLVAALDFGPDRPKALVGYRPVPGRQDLDALLLEWDGEHVEIVHQWPESRIGDAAAGDVDGDGVIEGWIGTEYPHRRMVRIDFEDGRYRHGFPRPDLDALNSDLFSVVTHDFDGDGTDALMLGYGPFEAWDVRIYRGEDRIFRRRLGTVHDVRIADNGDEPWLFAAVSNFYPVPDASGERPQGLYMFRYDREQDTFIDAGGIVQPRPLHRDSPSDQHLFVGDFDGDGWTDVLTQSRCTILARGSADGVRKLGCMERFRGVLALQVDDDPAHELIATVPGGESWLIGVDGPATQPVPVDPRYAPEIEAASVPEDLPPDVAHRWKGAETLRKIGMWREAAETYIDAAVLSTGSPAGADAHLRAASLLEQHQRHGWAGEVYMEAARDPRHARVACESAAHAFSRAHRFAEARDAARQWIEAGGPVEAEALYAELDGLVDRRQTHTLKFDRRIPPMTIEDPLLARRIPERGTLQIRQFSNSEGEVRVPLRWDGGPLTLAASVDVRGSEYQSGLVIGVRPVGQDYPPERTIAAITVAIADDGNGWGANISFRHPDGHFDLIRVPSDRKAGMSGRAEIELLPSRRSVLVRWRGADGVELERVIELSGPVDTEGQHELAVGRYFVLDEGWVSRVEIEEITVSGTGVDLDDVVFSAEQYAAHSRSDGTITDPLPVSPLPRALALVERGDTEGARAVLTDSPPSEHDLYRLVRLGEPELLALARRVAGDLRVAEILILDAVRRSTKGVDTLGGLRSLERALTYLDQVDDAPERTRLELEAMALKVPLLYELARATEAEEAVEAVLTRTEEVATERERVLRHKVLTQRCWQAIREEDSVTALAALEAAIPLADDPLGLLDQITAHPVVRTWRTREGWQDLLADG